MTADITLKIVDLMRQANPDLDTRILAQTEELREKKCVAPLIGKIIDDNDVKYLLSALALKDEDFSEFFPQIAGVKRQERQILAATIEEHFDECVHCSLKRGYDYEHDGQIKKICLQNKNPLLQILEEEDVAEGEHQTRETKENAADSSNEENLTSAATR